MINVRPLIALLMRQETVTVRFLWRDQTIATVRCALREGQVNRYTITVWDLEKGVYCDIPKARIVSYV